MIVLDASAAVELLAGSGARSEWVAERLLEANGIHVPHVLDVEVVSALRGLVQRGKITTGTAGEGLKTLSELPLRRYPAVLLLERIWSLRDRLTAYDATYVALAEALEAELVTTDLRLARAGGHAARISAPS